MNQYVVFHGFELLLFSRPSAFLTLFLLYFQRLYNDAKKFTQQRAYRPEIPYNGIAGKDINIPTLYYTQSLLNLQEIIKKKLQQPINMPLLMRK